MSPASFFLTGAGGFVGRAVAGHLRAAGHTVAAADLRGASHELDVLDEGALELAVREARPTVLVHGAALTTPKREDGLDLIEVNVRGTLNALEAARMARVAHFVLLSSAGVYAPGPGPIAEDSPTSSATAYGLSKLLAEGACTLGRGSMTVWLLRLGPVYGPGEGPSASRARPSLVYEMAQAALEGRPATLPRASGEVYNWLHTRDLARLLEIIASQPGDGEARLYNVAGPPVTGLELARAFAAIRPGFDLGRLAWTPNPPPRHGALDASKIARELGFAPAVPLAEGLLDYLTPTLEVTQ